MRYGHTWHGCLREQVWACTFFEEFAAKNCLDMIGTDRVLFETDYPHPVCLYGGEVREKIDAAFGDLSKEVRDRVLFSNAAELYGVGTPDRPWQGGSSLGGACKKRLAGD